MAALILAVVLCFGIQAAAARPARTLQQAPASAFTPSSARNTAGRELQRWEVAVVTNGAEFVAALRQGAVHIELQNHIDLSGWGWTFSGTFPNNSGFFEPTDRLLTIRGNCNTPFPTPTNSSWPPFTPPLLPPKYTKARQCLVLFGSNTSLLFWNRYVCRNEPLWLDNVYFRGSMIETRGSVATVTDRAMWLTNVTYQGSGVERGHAFYSSMGLFAEDSIFADWGASQGSVVTTRGTAYFSRCLFQDNSVPSAVIEAREDAYVRLERCSFARNGANHTLLVRNEELKGYGYTDGFAGGGSAEGGLDPVEGEEGGLSISDIGREDEDKGLRAAFYSDVVRVVGYSIGNSQPTLPFRLDPGGYLDYSDPWFITVSQEVSRGVRVQPDTDILFTSPESVPSCLVLETDLPTTTGWPRRVHGPLSNMEIVGIALGLICPLVVCMALRLNCCGSTTPRRGRGRGRSRSRSRRDLDRLFSLPPQELALRIGRDHAAVSRHSAKDMPPPDIPACNILLRVAWHLWHVPAPAAAPAAAKEHNEDAPEDPPVAPVTASDASASLANTVTPVDATAAVPQNTAEDVDGRGAVEGGAARSAHVQDEEAQPAVTYLAANPRGGCSTRLQAGVPAGSRQAGGAEESSVPGASCSREKAHSDQRRQDTPKALPMLANTSMHDKGAFDSFTVLRRTSQCSEDSTRDTGASAAVHDTSCVICFENVGDHVLVPCGHGGYCSGCAQRLFRSRAFIACPICRSKLGAVGRIPLETPIGEAGEVEWPEWLHTVTL